jgi:hypothetical protein
LISHRIRAWRTEAVPPNSHSGVGARPYLSGPVGREVVPGDSASRGFRLGGGKAGGGPLLMGLALGGR